MYPLTVGMVVSTSSLWEDVQRELQQLPVRVVLEMVAIDDTITFLKKLERFRPDVVMLDPSRMPEGFTDLVKTIRDLNPAPQVMVVRETPDPNEILAFLRAGATEYVYPPLGVNLREAFERISEQRNRSETKSAPRGGKIVGFLSAKGGCGATTLACHTALDIARTSGKDTLLADMDFASGMVRTIMQSRSRYSVLDALQNIQRMDPSFWRGLVSNGTQGLEVIASTPAEICRELPKATDIRHLLRFVKTQYEWSVVDLGHGLEPHTLAAMEEVDHLVLVATLEMPALHQAKTVFRYVSDSGYSKDKVLFVLNRMPRRGEISTSDIESVLSAPVYATIPNDYRALENAYSSGKMLADDHPLRLSIGQLAGKLTGMYMEEKKKKFSLFGFTA